VTQGTMGLPGDDRRCKRRRKQCACLGWRQGVSEAEDNGPAWGTAGGASEVGSSALAWGQQEARVTQGTMGLPGD